MIIKERKVIRVKIIVDFDFVIEEGNGNKKVLRFYPIDSNVHGFDEEAPETWEDVYKTYMTFSVLRFWEDWDKKGVYETEGHELFSYYKDEGEGLRYLREVLQEIIFGVAENKYYIRPFGDGIDWEIVKSSKYKCEYTFTMVNSESGQCYRFYLNRKKIEEFYNTLDDFLEYMLKHSEGI